MRSVMRWLLVALTVLIPSSASWADEPVAPTAPAAPVAPATKPKQWSLDAAVSVSPFDNFDLGFGGNVLVYASEKLGLGLTGQVKFDSVQNDGSTARVLETEIGARLKYYISGSVNGTGVTLSPNIFLIEWADRNQVAYDKKSGARLGLDVGYEMPIDDKLFIGFGTGLGVYLKKPEIQFSNTLLRWDSNFLLQFFGQAGVRL